MEQKQQSTLEEDRLSALPDTILCHILSFLSAEDCATASVLGKRWKFLWAHVPTLSFDVANYDHSEIEFATAINSAMLERELIGHRGQSLNVFRIHCNDSQRFGVTEFQLEMMLRGAIIRGVKNVDLYLHHEVNLPPALFQCKTLETLTLRDCTGIPDKVDLPKLQKLLLDCMDYDDGYETDEALQKLIDGCPILEELIIRGTIKGSMCFTSNTCTISSATLKKLAMEFRHDLDDFNDPAYRIQVIAPSLEMLEVVDCSYAHLYVSCTESLSRAHIQFSHRRSEGIVQFLSRLCHLKWLKVLADYSQGVNLGVQVEDGVILNFGNLTKVEVGVDYSLLNKILEAAPCLKMLVVQEVPEAALHWIEPDRVPTCLTCHLKIVRICQFRCMEQEFSLIKYLLRNSKVLERMGILFKPLGVDPLSKVNARITIASFERASVECQMKDDENILFQRAVDVPMDNSSPASVVRDGAFDDDLQHALQLSMQDSLGVQAIPSNVNNLLADQSPMPSAHAQREIESRKDRLSALPAEILLHIISLLPNKDSVRTSVLGKRWKFLWAHVPTLSFDVADYDDSETEFAATINRAMLERELAGHRGQSLNVFRIHGNDSQRFGVTKFQLEMMLRGAIIRGVKNVDLYLHHEVNLPPALFQCKTLETLTLRDCTGIPDKIELPKLHKLSLNCVDYEGGYETDEALRKLLAGCPVLRELIIIGTIKGNICSPTLKKLTMKFLHDLEDFDDPDYRIQVVAPSLTILEVFDCSYAHLDFPCTSNLNGARIQFNHCRSEGIVRFLSTLSHLKWLEVLTDYDQGMNLGVPAEDGLILSFGNLTKVEVRVDYSLLFKILEAASCLKMLVVQEVPEAALHWIEPDRVPTCLTCHLKIVRICQFRCMEQEFALIKYLLRNSKVLENMGILFKPLGVDPLSKVDARSKIASFERASMECQLQDDENVLFQKAVDVTMDNSSSAAVRDTGAFDQDLHLAIQLSMQDRSGVQAKWSDGNKLLTDQSLMPSVVAQDNENALLKKAIDTSIDGSISNVVVLDTVMADAFDDRDSQPAFQVKDLTGELSNPPDVSELLANQSPGPSILAQLPGADPIVFHAKDLLAPMQTSLSENKEEDETVLEDEKK